MEAGAEILDQVPGVLGADPAADGDRSGLPMVEARGLSRSFGPIRALRGIDLSIRRGEFLTLFGPNGAGKTTLIKVLAGLLKPTGGWARIEGIDLASGRDALKARIGVISHQPFLYENLTAAENLRFFARMYGVPDREGRARALLEELGLAARAHDLVRTFSRGMQQRLAIARALLHRPALLLLDEPHTGLDPHASEVLAGMLGRLRDGHRTIIMTTHNLAQGLSLADTVAILVGGRIAYREGARGLGRATLEAAYASVIAPARQVGPVRPNPPKADGATPVPPMAGGFPDRALHGMAEDEGTQQHPPEADKPLGPGAGDGGTDQRWDG